MYSSLICISMRPIPDAPRLLPPSFLPSLLHSLPSFFLYFILSRFIRGTIQRLTRGSIQNSIDSETFAVGVHPGVYSTVTLLWGLEGVQPAVHPGTMCPCGGPFRGFMRESLWGSRSIRGTICGSIRGFVYPEVPPFLFLSPLSRFHRRWIHGSICCSIQMGSLLLSPPTICTVLVSSMRDSIQGFIEVSIWRSIQSSLRCSSLVRTQPSQEGTEAAKEYNIRYSY